jgi:uncharacterized protein
MVLMDPVNHFEIPFDDKEKVMGFYSKVFDWKLNDMPDMKYIMAHTCEIDEKHMPKNPGEINGGFYKRDEKLAKGPVIVITVKSIDNSMEKIKEAGGEITMEKVKVGDMGMYAQFKDTEGNFMGLWENLKKEGSEDSGEEKELEAVEKKVEVAAPAA